MVVHTASVVTPMLVIPAPRRQKQEDSEFQSSLGCIERPVSDTKTNECSKMRPAGFLHFPCSVLPHTPCALGNDSAVSSPACHLPLASLACSQLHSYYYCHVTPPLKRPRKIPSHKIRAHVLSRAQVSLLRLPTPLSLSCLLPSSSPHCIPGHGFLAAHLRAFALPTMSRIPSDSSQLPLASFKSWLIGTLSQNITFPTSNVSATCFYSLCTSHHALGNLL